MLYGSCKICESLYCSNCFIYDNHIKKELKNLYIKNNKCQIHQKELSRYCITCKKYLCNYCIKSKLDNPHDNHRIKNLFYCMPSLHEINNMKQKIRKNAEFNERVIYSINIWQKKINIKIENLKINLRKEKEFFEKLIMNFNQYFVNYTYYQNFYTLNNYSVKEYNKQFKILENSYDLEIQTKALMNYFFSQKKIKEKKLNY